MFNCQICKTPMKPLFTSWFCPKDCDRPKQKLVESGIFIVNYTHPNTGRQWAVYQVVGLPKKGNWTGYTGVQLFNSPRYREEFLRDTCKYAEYVVRGVWKKCDWGMGALNSELPNTQKELDNELQNGKYMFLNYIPYSRQDLVDTEALLK